MKNKRLSEKLIRAWACLGDEGIGDCDYSDFARAFQQGMFTERTVYSIMRGLHLRWDAKHLVWKTIIGSQTKKLLNHVIQAARKCEMPHADD